MKKIRLIYTVLSLLALLSGISVSALTFPGTGGSDGPVVISSSPTDMDLEVIVLEENEELTIDRMPLGNFYPYLDENGRGYLLPVEWNLHTVPGLQKIQGSPLFPDGYILSEGYDGDASWLVFRQGDNAVLELQSIGKPYAQKKNYMVSLNGNCSEELLLPRQATFAVICDYWELNVVNRPEFYWEWDISTVDTAKIGEYPITAELQCPDWVDVPEAYRHAEAMVYVLPEDRVEIFAVSSLYSDGEMSVQWLYDSQLITEAVLERKMDGIWESCPEEWYTWHSWNTSRNAWLSLYLDEIPVETPTTLRLRYAEPSEDGMTDWRTTEPILLDVPENWKELTGEFDRGSIITTLEGDRDGGDAGGSPMPDLEQSVLPGNTLQDDPMQYLRLLREIVTENDTIVSGLRLQVSREKYIMFEKHGVSVEIPSVLLKDMCPQITDLFRITILYPHDDTVQITVSVNDIPADDLTGTIVRIPYSSQDVRYIVCRDVNGTVVSEGVWEENSGTVRFHISAPGLYTIENILPVPDSQEPAESVQTPEPPEQLEAEETVSVVSVVPTDEPVPEISESAAETETQAEPLYIPAEETPEETSEETAPMSDPRLEIPVQSMSDITLLEFSTEISPAETELPSAPETAIPPKEIIHEEETVIQPDIPAETIPDPVCTESPESPETVSSPDTGSSLVRGSVCIGIVAITGTVFILLRGKKYV